MVGQINAGSGVALVNSTGLSIALLNQIQAENTKTELLEVQAQQTLTQAAYKSTLAAGQKEAMNSYLSAASSVVGAVSSGVEFGMATTATNQITTSANEHTVATQNLDQLQGVLDQPAHVVVQGGASHAPRAEASAADVEAFKRSITSKSSLAPATLTDLKTKTYTPAQKEQLERSLKQQRAHLETHHHDTKTRVQYANEANQAKVKMGKALSEAPISVVQGLNANKKAQDTADAEVQRAASSQVSRSVDTTDQNRTSTFKAIEALIGATTQALQSNNMRG